MSVGSARRVPRRPSACWCDEDVVAWHTGSRGEEEEDRRVGGGRGDLRRKGGRQQRQQEQQHQSVVGSNWRASQSISRCCDAVLFGCSSLSESVPSLLLLLGPHSYYLYSAFGGQSVECAK